MVTFEHESVRGELDIRSVVGTCENILVIVAPSKMLYHVHTVEYQGQFRLNMEFKESLSDRTTQDYQDLEKDVISTVCL